MRTPNCSANVEPKCFIVILYFPRSRAGRRYDARESVPLTAEEFGSHTTWQLATAHREFADPALYKHTALVVDTRARGGPQLGARAGGARHRPPRAVDGSQGARIIWPKNGGVNTKQRDCIGGTAGDDHRERRLPHNPHTRLSTRKTLAPQTQGSALIRR